MTEKVKTGIEELGNLLTVGNFARFKQITREEVFSRINDGTLEAVKIDGIIFIRNEKHKEIKHE